MKQQPLWACLILATLLLGSHCTWLRNMRGGASAKESAVQAIVTTTRSAVLLMTAAGIAYNAGAFGVPGSTRAEDTWKKIATESLRMNAALNAWSEAIKANKDASAFQSMVSQALAVIGALLPSHGGSGGLASLSPAMTVEDAIATLACPGSFRVSHEPFAIGGAR